MINPDLIAILCCPATRQPLALADNKYIESINQAITAGKLKNQSGQPITQTIDAGLIRADQLILYPVRQDIPVLLIDEGIPLAQLPPGT
jgi:uncharacterized protein YbaR (Trm112 family)